MLEQEPENLPAQIADALVSIPKGLTPGAIKALGRLLGAAVDIPVAWLQQQKAKIDAKTSSYKLIEETIAQSAAAEIANDTETAKRALNTLVRKEYRKQVNREAVAKAMVEDLSAYSSSEFVSPDTAEELHSNEIDEDWMNVFEQYAENASSERLQNLWGRVLSGEVRKPGKYSLRTLRFLSEFSQFDAITFENFVKNALGDIIPYKLAKEMYPDDIKDLIYLEANGLLQGISSGGFQKNLSFNNKGYCAIREGNLVLLMRSEPNSKISFEVLALTPLGQELLGLVANREVISSARRCAFAIKRPEITEAQIGTVGPLGSSNSVTTVEILWKDESENKTPVASVE